MGAIDIDAGTAALSAASLPARRAALEHLETAHHLLLANDAQARALRARKVVDARNALSVPSLNLFRDTTHDESVHVRARFVEAQLYVRHALDALGLPITAEGALLPVVGKAEAYLDSVFDLWAVQQTRSAVEQNGALAASVRRAHEALRLSSPALSAVQPLEAEEGGLAVREAAGEVFGLPGVGATQFWSPGKWVLMITLGLLTLAVLGFFVTALVAQNV